MKIELVNRTDTKARPMSADISDCVDDLMCFGKKREILDELRDTGTAELNSLKVYTVRGSYGLLDLAAYYNDHELLKQFVDFGVRPGEENQAALYFAVQKGNLENIKLLLESGARIDISPDILPRRNVPTSFWDQKTKIEPLLITAVRNNQLEIVNCLLDAGAGIDVVSDPSFDENGSGEQHTPLFIAIEKGFIEIAEALIKYDSTALSVGDSGRRPMLYSVYGSNVKPPAFSNDKMFEFFVKFEAEIIDEIRESDPWAYAEKAIKGNNPKILNWLFEKIDFKTAEYAGNRRIGVFSKRVSTLIDDTYQYWGNDTFEVLIPHLFIRLAEDDPNVGIDERIVDIAFVCQHYEFVRQHGLSCGKTEEFIRFCQGLVYLEKGQTNEFIGLDFTPDELKRHYFNVTLFQVTLKNRNLSVFRHITGLFTADALLELFKVNAFSCVVYSLIWGADEVIKWLVATIKNCPEFGPAIKKESEMDELDAFFSDMCTPYQIDSEPLDMSPMKWNRYHLAAYLNDLSLAEIACQQGDNINQQDIRVNSSNTDLGGVTPLMWAAHYDHFEMLSFLIDHGASIDTTDETGSTALYYAVRQGHRQSAKVLLEKGADPACIPYGDKYLGAVVKPFPDRYSYWDSIPHFLETFRYLTPEIGEFEPPFSRKSKLDLLSIAIFNKDRALIDLLLEYNVPLNPAISSEGGRVSDRTVFTLSSHTTPLLASLGISDIAEWRNPYNEGVPEITKLLLDKGAKPYDEYLVDAINVWQWRGEFDAINQHLPDISQGRLQKLTFTALSLRQFSFFKSILPYLELSERQPVLGNKTLLEITTDARLIDYTNALLEANASPFIETITGYNIVTKAIGLSDPEFFSLFKPYLAKTSEDIVHRALEWFAYSHIDEDIKTDVEFLMVRNLEIHGADIVLDLWEFRHRNSSLAPQEDSGILTESEKAALLAGIEGGEMDDDFDMPDIDDDFDVPDSDPEISDSAKEAMLAEMEKTSKNPEELFTTYSHYSALMFFAYKGSLKEIQLLLDKQADVNLKDIRGATALHYALVKGHMEAAELLQKNGAEIDSYAEALEIIVRDDLGRARASSSDVFSQKGPFEYPPVFFLAKGQLELLQIILENGLDTNLANGNGKTLLEHQLDLRAKENIRLLLKSGADPNLPELFLLKSVCLFGAESASDVLEAGAEVNAKDKYGNTALIRAVRDNLYKEVELLLLSKADPEIRNQMDKSALDYALENYNSWQPVFEKYGFDLGDSGVEKDYYDHNESIIDEINKSRKDSVFSLLQLRDISCEPVVLQPDID